MKRPKAKKDQLAANSAQASDGVVNSTQLRSSGYSDWSIGYRERTGRLTRHHPKTFLHPGAPRTWRQEAAAALLWLGKTCALFGQSACRAWGIPAFQNHEGIEATGPHNIRRRKGVRYRRCTKLPSDHVTKVSGLTVTTPARTIFDLAGLVGPKVLGETIDEFLRRRLVTLEKIGDVMLAMGTQGRKGMRMLRSLLEARMGEGGPSHNATERRLYKILTSQGLRPTRQFHVTLGKREFYVDCAFPSFMLGIEAISYKWHGMSSDWDKDRDRVRLLREAGWIIVEFTWQDIWFRPDYVLAEVRKHLDLLDPTRGGSQIIG